MANTAPSFSFGQVPSVPNWQGYFSVKVDETNGNIVSPTVNGTISGTPTWSGLQTFSGGAVISGGALSGVFTGDWMYAGNVGATGTGAFGIPAGTTGQQPNTGNVGQIRYNSTTGRYEFGIGGAWKNHVRLDGDTMTGPLGITTLTMGGAPFASAPVASSNGNMTIVGLRAGIGVNASAFELTAVGYYAGGSGGNTLLDGASGGTGMTGPENTCIGWYAGTQMTSGQFNTAVGVNSQGHNITGNSNTSVGTDSMRNATAIGFSVGVGVNALREPNTASWCVAIGNGALTCQAGGLTTTCNSNIAIGYESLMGTTATALTQNVMVGNNTGMNVTNAANNTGVGQSVMQNLTSGSLNVGFGVNALMSVTTDAAQTALGTAALKSATGGSNNIAIGYQAGFAITSATNNTIVGTNTGKTLTTGSGNLYLGVGNGAIDATSASEAATFRVGGHATNLMRATGINTATPAFFFDWLPGSTSYANDAAAATGGVGVGQIYRNGSAVQVRVS